MKTDILEVGLVDTMFGVILAIPSSGILVWVEILVGITVVFYNVLKIISWWRSSKEKRNSKKE